MIRFDSLGQPILDITLMTETLMVVMVFKCCLEQELIGDLRGQCLHYTYTKPLVSVIPSRSPIFDTLINQRIDIFSHTIVIQI